MKAQKRHRWVDGRMETLTDLRDWLGAYKRVFFLKDFSRFFYLLGKFYIYNISKVYPSFLTSNKCSYYTFGVA